ncbi:hypothetical protein [Aneurinibacillus thermoaerophilus]|uniref:hypothetical protein n=1 Tax=Aneurinibacillus thermoaerophilus TaxID=143495 RepID=UPI002E21575D|nr:hypothetical protein [Aneurinibacillus thermoaerophilus]MED0738856.1 hypothetical protein [Aneurinibacillus thermoaerophilus]MED0763220.1 hypothetical protein [Aneurinibacillus thermoaerophilus]
MSKPMIAKIDPLTKKTKKMLVKMIEKVIANSGGMERAHGIDISYIVSFEDNTLVVSVGSNDPIPDASPLEFLTEKYGEPTQTFAKPSSITPGVMVFYMVWEKFNQYIH